VLFMQRPCACCGWQIFPQSPQSVADDETGVSQPSARDALQSLKPMSQAPDAQVEFWQMPWLCAPAQLLPQEPQFEGELESFVSQPSSAVLLQSPKPDAQVRRHSPVLHSAAAFWVPQVTPQWPQLARSD